MRTHRSCTAIALIALLVGVSIGSRLNAQPVVIDFEQFDGLNVYQLPLPAMVPELAQLCDQLLADYGLIFTSGAPYVAVTDYYRCIPSGTKYISGVAPDGTLTWSSDHPITVTFRKPGDGAAPGVTDFVSIQGDLCGDGQPITITAYDVDGNPVASDTDGDWGAVLRLSTPTRVIHQVKFFGHAEPYHEGVGWDNLAFNPPIAIVQDFYMCGITPDLALNAVAPTDTTAKYKDSPSVNRSAYDEVGTWTCIVSPDMTARIVPLVDLTAWVGLKNSDDQGTYFDLRAEVLKTGDVIASGETTNIQGVTRNPAKAKEVVVRLTSHSACYLNAGDVLSLRILTKVTEAGGHNSAVGLRLYYDSIDRPSRLVPTRTP